jgi:hypothetical protein
MEKDGFLNLPNESLKAVIAGCEAEYKGIGAIVMSADSGLKPSVIQASNKNRLEIVE